MMDLSSDEHFTGGLPRYDGKEYRINVYRNGSLAIEQTSLNELLNHPDVKRVLRCMAEIDGHPVYPSWYEDMAAHRFDPPIAAEEED
jgi:hypothetical protein